VRDLAGGGLLFDGSAKVGRAFQLAEKARIVYRRRKMKSEDGGRCNPSGATGFSGTLSATDAPQAPRATIGTMTAVRAAADSRVGRFSRDGRERMGFVDDDDPAAISLGHSPAPASGISAARQAIRALLPRGQSCG
jgi:hypothetical protein